MAELLRRSALARSGLLLAVTLIAATLGARSAYAECLAPGVGGTGVTAGEQLASEDGIGGTGQAPGDADGIGGTGIYGTITHFGSICVNGTKVEFDASTPVTMDGRPATVEQLQLGQVVGLVAHTENGHWQAEQVAIQSAVIGPVQSWDPDSGRLRVLEQTLEIDATTHLAEHGLLEKLGVGTFVEASGLRRADDTLVVSRLARVESSTLVSLTGRLERDEHDTLRIGELEMPDAARLLAMNMGTGTMVRLRGNWNAESARLENARAETVQLFQGSVSRVVVEGFVRSRGPQRISLGHLDLSVPEAAARRPQLDQRVYVYGRAAADGPPRMDSFRVRPRPARPAAVDGRPRGGQDTRPHEARPPKAERSPRPESTQSAPRPPPRPNPPRPRGR